LLGFVAIYPLLANPFAAPVFGLPKLVFLMVTAIMLCAIWLDSLIKNGSREIPRSNLRMPIILFFGVALISSMQSVHPLTSLFGQYGRWEGLISITCYIVLYCAAFRAARNERAFGLIIATMLASALLVSVIAIIEHFWTNPFLLISKVYCGAGYGQPNVYEVGRSMATFGSTTFLATYLALVLPLAGAVIAGRKRTAAVQGTLYALFMLAAAALLLSYGRAAWIGVVLAFMLLGWLQRDIIRHYLAPTAILVGVIITTLIIIQSFGGVYSPIDRVASIFDKASSLTRVQMWDAALPLVAHNPLLGSGPDTFKYVFGIYKPQGWVEHFANPLIDKAHNDALQLAVTHGLLGLLPYLWLFTGFIWLGARRVRSLEDQRARWIAAGLISAAFAYMVDVQFSFSHFSTAPFFWLFLGFGSALLNTDTRSAPVSFSLSTERQTYARALIAVAVTCLAVLAAFPLVADIYFSKAQNLRSAGRVSEAIDPYRRAITFNRYEPLYELALAETYFKRANTTRDDRYLQAGSTAFAEAARLNPIDEQVYFRAGVAYLAAGRLGWPGYLQKAISVYKQGLMLNPVMVDAYTDIGVAYATLGDYDSAIQSWTDALGIEPNNDRIYFNLGWTYKQKGQIPLAKKAFLKAYQLNPKMTDAKAAYDRL
jgi:putative inorganic carbon (HCO3(-)) transporter